MKKISSHVVLVAVLLAAFGLLLAGCSADIPNTPEKGNVYISAGAYNPSRQAASARLAGYPENQPCWDMLADGELNGMVLSGMVLLTKDIGTVLIGEADYFIKDDPTKYVKQEENPTFPGLDKLLYDEKYIGVIFLLAVKDTDNAIIEKRYIFVDEDQYESGLNGLPTYGVDYHSSELSEDQDLSYLISGCGPYPVNPQVIRSDTNVTHVVFPMKSFTLSRNKDTVIEFNIDTNDDGTLNANTGRLSVNNY